MQHNCIPWKKEIKSPKTPHQKYPKTVPKIPNKNETLHKTWVNFHQC